MKASETKLQRVTVWDEQNIRQRAEAMADRALQVWKYFCEQQTESMPLLQGVKGTTPVAVVMLGQRFPVSSWREVAQKTLETMCDLDGDCFDQIAAQFPRFIGRDSTKFRTSRKLPNGAFMELNLSATAIHRFCIQASELAGLSSTDWRVEFEAKTGDSQPVTASQIEGALSPPYIAAS